MNVSDKFAAIRDNGIPADEAIRAYGNVLPDCRSGLDARRWIDHLDCAR